MTVQTIKSITGCLRPVNWARIRDKYEHLKSLPFQPMGRRQIVDMLIGVDHAELHCSLKEVLGKPGEPIARLTPLGWTAIGGLTQQNEVSTNFGFGLQQDVELAELVTRFWEHEELETDPDVDLEELAALQSVERIMKYTGERYEVGLP